MLPNSYDGSNLIQFSQPHVEKIEENLISIK